MMRIRQPDDWHCHLRDGDYLERTVADEATQFRRAIVMPNLITPITTVASAEAYRNRIIACIPDGLDFTPLMTLYLTGSTTPHLIRAAADSNIILAAKLYPAGVTTHSQAGITNLKQLYPALEAMQDVDMPLLIHGESTNQNIDIFDRESDFLDKELPTLLRDFPSLRIVLEHISTEQAVRFIQSARNGIAATITAHHLLYHRNQLLEGGLRPHYYCMPILKRQSDQLALRQAATSGHPRFFLGTDSAPHAEENKLSDCGCAGIYSAHAAIELYAEVFEQENALDRLEAFSSVNGANFYGLPLNPTTIMLKKQTWKVPSYLSFGQEVLKPLRSGEAVIWKLQK